MTRFLLVAGPDVRAMCRAPSHDAAKGALHFESSTLFVHCEIAGDEDRATDEGVELVCRLGVVVDAERREGRYAIVRIDKADGGVTIETDELGMYPLYVHVGERATILTNSLAAMREAFLVADRSPDAVGIASFLSLGWPLADRTLDTATRVVPPGLSRITGGANPTFVPACDATLGFVVNSGERAAPRDVANSVLLELSACVAKRFSRRSDTIVQLTGGQDSRVVLAACLHAGLRPDCITRGADDDPEVVVALAVARAATCRHRAEREESQRTDWRDLARMLLARTDGMVSLWQLADVRAHIEPARSMLGGIGGETARRYYHQESTLDRAASGEEIVTRLQRRLAKNPGELLTKETFAAFERALRERLMQLKEPLRDPRDLPDVFYAFERVRRWGGANARKIDPAAATLPILASGAWTRAALAIAPEERVRCALHREFVLAAAPALVEVPLLGATWESSRSGWSRALSRWLQRDIRQVAESARSTTIELERDRLRAELIAELGPRILDSRDSWFFDSIDRNAFEGALSRTDAVQRDAAAQSLFAALTVWLAREGVDAVAAR